MNHHLPQNIRALRRQQGMMQEQLAEALGVSVGAVSKWERGAATPDLGYILEMADLFSVSMDALVGYEAQSGTVDALEARIHALQRQKDYAAAITEAEKALIRYPNDFRIVYRCAAAYQTKGLETGDMPSSEKAVALFSRCIPLLSQNTNPAISEPLLRKEIAQCLLAMDRESEGIEILKAHNPCGINNSLIGYTLASSKRCTPEEAADYLVRAYADCMESLIRTMCGYANMYERQHDNAAALDALLWLIHYLESLKTQADAVCYVDKLLAPFYAECAYLCGQNGLTEEARSYLRSAHILAAHFDTNPAYGVKNLRFCIGDTKNATVFDNMGSTAMAAVKNIFMQGNSTPEILQYWEELEHEHPTCEAVSCHAASVHAHRL